MINTMTTYTTAAGTPATIGAGLYMDFLTWIDRSPKTTRTYTVNLKQFAAWMKYAGIEQPRREDILSYREWLTTEHEAITLDPESLAGWSYRTDSTGEPVKVTCKPNTAAQYLRSVCQFFRWTAAEGLYPDIAANVHAPKIRSTTHRKEALKPAEVLTIENSIDRSTEQGKRLYAMYLLSVTAGLRTVELSRANIKDLETKGGSSVLWIWGKGHTEPDEKKPLAPEVAAAIREYLDSRTDKPTSSSPLFVATGNRSGGKRLATTTISTMLKKAMQQAGYDSERLTAHSLRHTAGTNVMELTGDLYQTQKYMRHSNPATTEIYLHTETEKTEAGISQKLYDLYHGKQANGTARERLETILDKMNQEQLEKLADIAAAMV